MDSTWWLMILSFDRLGWSVPHRTRCDCDCHPLGLRSGSQRFEASGSSEAHPGGYVESAHKMSGCAAKLTVPLPIRYIR